MANIVTVNVSQQVGSIPSTLQRTGALISTGGTTLAANASSLLTQLTDLTPLLAGAVSITAASTTWASGVVTMTTATPHGFTTGDSVTVAGFLNTYTGYNGTFAITVTGVSTFTYAVVASLPTPASGTAVVTDADVAQLVAMATTFFAQGSSASVYVLEMGHGTITSDIAAFSTYLTAHPNAFYSYLVPRLWDADATFVTLVNTFTAATAKTYFHVTAQLSTYASFAGAKAVKLSIEAPGIPVTEFSAAAAFWVTLSYNPSPTNQVTPLRFSFLVGVTAYPVTNTQAVTFATANLDYVTTAAEGGFSNKMLALGTLGDGNPFNYWYSVDWMQINCDQALAAAVINGSNNPQAPLYYDQPGINRLEGVLQQKAAQGVSYGLAIGPVTPYGLSGADFTTLLTSGSAPPGVLINAIPYRTYVSANPGDFTIGKYAGLAISYTPARGFQSIVLNLNVSNFIP